MAMVVITVTGVMCTAGLAGWAWASLVPCVRRRADSEGECGADEGSEPDDEPGAGDNSATPDEPGDVDSGRPSGAVDAIKCER